MRRITKGPQPLSLRRYATSWSSQLIAARLIDDLPAMRRLKRRYLRHKDIMQELLRESFGKCVYCESEVDATGANELDHYWHFSANLALAFEWTNYLLACSYCNGRKSDNNDPELPYINPSVEQPSDHLRFYGLYLWHINSSNRGEKTHLELELNRDGLIKRRERIVKELDELIKTAISSRERHIQIRLYEGMWERANNDRQDSLFIEYFLRARGVDVALEFLRTSSALVTGLEKTIE